jgi:hypothetical protein
MAFIFRRHAAKSQRGAELEQDEASRLVGSPGDRAYSLSRNSTRGGVSAISVIVALLLLIVLLGLMLASGV